MLRQCVSGEFRGDGVRLIIGELLRGDFAKKMSVTAALPLDRVDAAFSAASIATAPNLDAPTT